jgi:hypothetical protein
MTKNINITYLKKATEFLDKNISLIRESEKEISESFLICMMVR